MEKNPIYNYKQLSVGVVLLTADYDGPQRELRAGKLYVIARHTQ